MRKTNAPSARRFARNLTRAVLETPEATMGHLVGRQRGWWELWAEYLSKRSGQRYLAHFDLETVRRLVEAGHRVYLAARDPERGHAAAETVAQQEGHLDVLVNNAGISRPLRDIHEYTGDDAAGVLLTNLVGYVRVIHAFLPLLERSEDPRIVNVSSGIGSFGLFHDETRTERDASTPLYGPAKAGINMLTVRYARLLPGIRINAADPGMTATDLSGDQGHSVTEGTDVILALVGADGPTGTFRDRDGALPW